MTDPQRDLRPGLGRRAAGAVLRAIVTVLLGPDDSDLPFKLLSIRTIFRIVGPGSLILAIPLMAAGTQFTNTDYTTGPLWPQDFAWQPGATALVFAAWQVVPLVIAGYRPLLGWFVAMTGILFAPFAVVPLPDNGTQPWPWLPHALIAYLPIQYAVARRHRLWIAIASWLLVGIAGTFATQHEPTYPYTDTNASQWMLAAVALVIGAAIRTSALARQRVVQEELVTAEERSRRQLLEERTRIARELHDVVAHHMSMIAVQASTAEYRLAELSDEAKQEFTSISESARQSLTEMRRLLAVLRSDESGERAPQPGLDGIGALVEATRRAGTNVRYEARDLPTKVSETVSLTGYRIVQEALSNVIRHAPGAATKVALNGSPTELTIRVTNAQPEGVVKPLEQNKNGHGLVGMRERTAMLGGTLSAERRQDGGFEVRATIPLAGDAHEEEQ